MLHGIPICEGRDRLTIPRGYAPPSLHRAGLSLKGRLAQREQGTLKEITEHYVCCIAPRTLAASPHFLFRACSASMFLSTSWTMMATSSMPTGGKTATAPINITTRKALAFR